MRHRNKFRKLGRTAAHRRATLRNLAAALIEHKRIETTLAKAKELRTFVEPLVTKARVGDLHRRRLVMDALKNKEAAKILFGDVVGTVGDRPGGYTRVVKTGYRRGDAAQMAIIEFVDYNEIANERDASKEEARTQAREKRQKEEAEAAAQQAPTGTEAPPKE
ncbi:MAG: 50S ribosomal protein L17 [Ignavibacteriales bacterium]|nr:50S ribosomal protein L17 [Ignavibacteriales bacterium]